MRFSLLLRAMVAKELRGIVRERQQRWALAVMLLVMVGVIVASAGRMGKESGSRRGAVATAPTTRGAASPQPPRNPMHYRWAAIGAAAGGTVFFSLGYLIATTLATFAGEKDERTLEILLACPVPDTTLFLAKCLSVLLPMSALGYLILLVPAGIGLIVFRAQLAASPVFLPPYLLVLSIPPLLLVNAAIVGLGAAISAKAQSLKSANQVFGLVIFGVIFGGAYGLPLLMRATGLARPLGNMLRDWLTLPFAFQYAVAMAVLGAPAVVMGLVGRAMFRRDKLLG